MEEQEIRHRLWLLKDIKNEHLLEMARNGGYHKSRKRDDVENYLLGIPKPKFETLCEEFRDAENSSNFIFVVSVDGTKKLLEKYEEILSSAPKHPVKGKIFYFLDTFRYDTNRNELRIRFNAIKQDTIIQYWDFDKNIPIFYQGDEIEVVPVRFMFDHNILIIRTPKKNVALELKDFILGSLAGEARLIRFGKEEVLKIVNYMTILRGAHVRYEGDEEIQSASFSAGENEENRTLKNLKKSEKFQRASMEGDLRNCRFSVPREPKEEEGEYTADEVVSMGINFKQGKIYFITHLTEVETRDWIVSILGQIDYKNQKIPLAQQFLDEEDNSENTR